MSTPETELGAPSEGVKMTPVDADLDVSPELSVAEPRQVHCEEFTVSTVKALNQFTDTTSDNNEEMKNAEDNEPRVQQSKSEAEPVKDESTETQHETGKERLAQEKSDVSSGTSLSRTGHTEVGADDSATSKDLPYSTRGRSTDRDMSSGEEKLCAIDTLEDIGRMKESPPATFGVSFLEALSEEERRTRTRFVPEVEGMHILRKNEIKDDLSLARSLVSSSGITSLKKSKVKSHDTMDGEDEGGTSPSEDGSTDAVRPGTKLLELPSRDLVVPSNAFVAPSVSSGDDEGLTTSIATLKTENGVKSPLLVDAITAFNPPRPPESVGTKKKHRMLRWERRPEDVEVDLNNYRKTVHRTRQELHKAEAEYNRLETIDAHLRWNFLDHLNLINEEYTCLSEEIRSVQQECIKAADLLTSRTRSRGAGKGNYVMRDVLSVLKTKGMDNADTMETENYPIIENPLACAGIGGLGPAIFNDWNRENAITQTQLAKAWTVPGDMVKTPYGEGLVLEVFPPQVVPEPSAKEADETNADNLSKKSDEKDIKRTQKDTIKKDYLGRYLHPRVAVKLSFGVGYFSIHLIKPLENPCLFSDGKLCNRWNKILETALSVGSTIDVEGMQSRDRQREAESLESRNTTLKMELEGTCSKLDSQSNDEHFEEERFMPFGANLLPTATGRGDLLQSISITEMERAMERALYQGFGVLGEQSNQGVTEELRRWEDDEQEFLTLHASVLQLRNALVRQKRFRLLNERTDTATAERYNRSAELVAEMRSDLKSLKHRLEEELNELGMDENATEQLLSNYYLGQKSPVDIGEASPLKRSRHPLGQIDGTRDSTTHGDYDRESGDDHDLSGDDLESRRPVKKLRPNN